MTDIDMTPEIKDVGVPVVEGDAVTPTQTIAGLPVLAAGEQPNFINLLVYGDAGAGKTLLCATAEEVEAMKPIIFVDVEGGTKTFARKYPNLQVIRPEDKYNKNGKLVKYGWDQFVDIVEWLTGDTHYNTVVVDSLSELYAICMNKTMLELVAAKPHRDRYVPDKREWSTTSAQMAEQIRKLIHTQKHVLCTALRDTRTNNETGVVVAHTPVLAGKLTFRVAGFFNELVYLDTETKGGKVTRRLLSQPANRYLAKTRDDRLPNLVHDPTMAKLADYLLAKEGNGDATTDAGN